MELTRKILVMKTTKDSTLDYNYHYELMKEIYKSLEMSNYELAIELHDRGYSIENKRYKLFNHQLFIENANYTKEGIYIKKDSICKLTLSGKQEIIKNIIFGFLEKGKLKLFDTSYKVVSIENDKNIKFNNITLYKVRNPIVATRQDEDKKIVFISPFEDDYYRVLANNLKRKYKLVYGKDYTGELYFDIEDALNIKKRFIDNVKRDSKSKSILIGYTDFELYLVADRDMQKVAYYCGFGSNNSLGMGATTFITSRRD